MDLGNSVTDIGEDAFCYCKKLTSVVIPDSVTSIGDGAFSHSGLKSIVIPGSVKSIGEKVFIYCENLSTVEIGIENVDATLLSGCSHVTSITLRNGVTTIGDQAFFDCYSLETIYIPKSVERIGASAFVDVKSICYAGSESEWNAIEKGDDWDYKMEPESDYTIYFNSIP